MLILLLGFIFLGYWAFMQSRSQFVTSLLPLMLRLIPSTNTFFILVFLRSLLLAALSGSQHLLAANGLQNIQSERFQFRWNILWICFSGLGVGLALLLMSALFKVSGGHFLAFGIVAYALRKFRALSACFWGFFFWGLFLYGIESALRAGVFLINEPQYREVMFALSDNRLGIVLAWFLGFGIVSYFLRLEYLSWVLSLTGLSLGIMAVNVALALVLAEAVAWSWIHWRMFRRSSAALQRIALAVFVFKGLVAVIFLIVFAFYRGEWMFISSLQLGASVERLAVLGTAIVIWTLASTLFLMFWGHFRARRSIPASAGPEETMIPRSWILPIFIQK